jgi:hypothetical protein
VAPKSGYDVASLTYAPLIKKIVASLGNSARDSGFDAEIDLDAVALPARSERLILQEGQGRLREYHVSQFCGPVKAIVPEARRAANWAALSLSSSSRDTVYTHHLGLCSRAGDKRALY